MKETLKGLDIKITGLESLGEKIPEAEETGKTPLENAKQKALAYYSHLKKPVFSCDTGLYFRNVSDDIQPGVKAARVNGERLTDRQMMEHYMSVAKDNGGKLTAYYRNAICLVLDDDTIINYDGEDIGSEDFYIVDKPHELFEEGFPINTISVHIESGKYYNDIQHEADKYSSNIGFYHFFKKVLENI
jgi:8-oxo-dGTP diphosphatase